MDPAWAPFLRDLKDASGILLGIAAETERTASTTVFDPEALEKINERLAGLRPAQAQVRSCWRTSWRTASSWRPNTGISPRMMAIRRSRPGK